MNQPSLSVPSFAKINWNLHILGRRPDGYHEVSTLLQTISLHDDLHFEVIPDGEVFVSCDDARLPTDGRNLIVRAANALKDRYRLTAGARVQLQKRIPTQAGLGGASSNAAITLLALTHLWEIETDADALLEIAATLGADVPFFLMGGCALATGTGAAVSPLPDEPNSVPQYLVAIKPNANVSTPEAYAAIDSVALTTSRSEPILSSSRVEAVLQDSSLLLLPDSLKNDFESVIFDIEPEIRRTKEALVQAGARGALLAGSGSSVFGIFDSSEEQQRAVEEIQLERGWRLFSCVTLSRNEYVGAVGSWSVPFL
ncbi:MAG TPA: 4-(cytidine 5'-diphospho)-2-C-methyl-D-erythritol kinase, partial [Pyrinomonadaceae bacterium]